MNYNPSKIKFHEITPIELQQIASYVLHCHSEANAMDDEPWYACEVHLAESIIFDRTRKIKINQLTVETWWDRKTRTYITTIKNDDGDEVYPADVTGCKDSAMYAHLNAWVHAYNLQKFGFGDPDTEWRGINW